MKVKLLRKIKEDYFIIKYPYSVFELKKDIRVSSHEWCIHERYGYKVYYGFLKLFYKKFRYKKDVNKFILKRLNNKYYRFSKKYWN